MYFAYPLVLAGIPLLLLPLFLLKRRRGIRHPNNRLLQGIPARFFRYYLASVLAYMALSLGICAMARAVIPHKDGINQQKSRDDILALDVSGSMGSPMKGKVPEPDKKDPDLDRELPGRPAPVTNDVGNVRDNGTNPWKGQRRIDHAMAAMLLMVRNRYLANQGDRIAIMGFDTEPHWIWPLTPELKVVYRNGLFMDEGMGGGTNFGRNPGPIDAAVEHFIKRGKSKARTFIMITDGEDQIYPSDMTRLIKLLKDNDVHFYVIGVGETLARRDVDIIRLVQAVGGKAYRVENANDLANCFKDIDETEQSLVDMESAARQQEIFFYFAFASAFMFMLSLGAEALFPKP